MKSQIKLGTVFGVELGLHYSWLVIALLITFSLVAQFHAVNHDWSEAARVDHSHHHRRAFLCLLVRARVVSRASLQRPTGSQFTKSPCSCSEE